MSERFVAAIVDGRARALIGDDRPQSAEGGREGAIVVVDAGAVIDELAPPGSAKAALYRLAAAKTLNPVFPEAVRDEVRAWQGDPAIDDPSLVDCTALAFVTIDGKTSRDLDQAVHVEANETGFTIRYALADAAHYVQPGTALFDEALRRGASYYLPGVMIPMLPRELSEDLVSLNENVDRRSMLFTMECDADGRCIKTRVERARIRSRAKLDWDGVQAFYDGGDGFGEAIDESLRALAEVGRRRMALAEARGVIRYRRSEVVVKLDDQSGLRFVVTKDVRRPVERYNEQISLLCNVEGAKLLRDGDEADSSVEPIYRVHPPPDEDRLRAFQRMLGALVESRGLDPSVWMWNPESSSLADYLDALPEDGEGGRLARAIHRQAVMVNVRSTFQTHPDSHHGVGAEVYARFSAPM
ncbi:MAG: RNB domain-containing ribonuclease, partial [Myxococcota bacterium]